MEQLIGTAPYRFQVIDTQSARVIENVRRGFFGNWSRPKRRIRWVSCTAAPTPAGTEVVVAASVNGSLVARAMGRYDRGPDARALQLVRLLTAGRDDKKTIYRVRHIPPGPVTLVASWAGVPYRLYTEPRFDAPRGAEVFTATELEAVTGGDATFVHVRVEGDVEGYVERDQIVAATDVATREAQTEAARFV